MSTTTTRNTYGTDIASVLVGKRTDADGWAHYEWTVTLTRAGQSITFPYRMGVGHQQTKCGKPMPSMSRYVPRPYATCGHQRCDTAGWKPTPPDLYAVLTSLKADCPDGASFADWCADFGYDTDSIKARDTYFACQESEDRSRRFFGADWALIRADEDYE